MVFGKQGREPMSKEEFLGKVTTNLSKDALADPDDIQKYYQSGNQYMIIFLKFQSLFRKLLLK